MTTQVKGYPFEVLIDGKTPGVVLSDHIKSLDWNGRSTKKKGQVSPSELARVRAKVKGLIG